MTTYIYQPFYSTVKKHIKSNWADRYIYVYCGNPGAQHLGQRQAAGSGDRGKVRPGPPPEEITSYAGAAHEWERGWPHYKREEATGGLPQGGGDR